MEPLHYGTTYSSVKDSSSWILWQGHENNSPPHSNHKQGRLWSALLAFAVFIVILIVLAIAALAIYMGAMRLDTGKYLTFDGSLRVTYGDQYTSKLSNQSSNEFKEKSNRYKIMVENLYSRSELGPAIRYCSITGFANGSLVVFFRLILDRRKIPKKLTNVEETAKKIIQEEANSLKPVALKNIRVDPKQIFIKRNMEQSVGSISEEFDKVSRNDVATEVHNGVIRKAHSTIAPVTRDKLGYRSESILKGSYKVTTSEADYTKDSIGLESNITDIINTMVDNLTSPLPDDSNKKISTEKPKSQNSKLKYSSPPPRLAASDNGIQINDEASGSVPATVVINPYHIPHSPGLTALISLKKEDEFSSSSVKTTLPDEIKREDNTAEPDLITLSPYILPAGEEPWKPILPENFTRHPQRRPTVTEEYGFSSGVGVAEVISDSSGEIDGFSGHAETLNTYLNSNKRVSSDTFALGQKMFDRYESRHEGPRSNEKVSTYQLNIRTDDKLLGDTMILHTGSGDIIRKPDVSAASYIEGDPENESTSSSSVYALPDFATLKRFHSLDTYLKSYNEMVSKRKNDDDSTLNTGRSSSAAKFNMGSLNLTEIFGKIKQPSSLEHSDSSTASVLPLEYKSSDLPIITLIPVRSNLGLGRPLRPRPKPTTLPMETGFPIEKFTLSSSPTSVTIRDEKDVASKTEEVLKDESVEMTTEFSFKTTSDNLSELTLTAEIMTTEIDPTTEVNMSNNELKNGIIDDYVSDTSDTKTIVPDLSAETTITTNMFTTDTESDLINVSVIPNDTTISPLHQIRQTKMSLDYVNQSSNVEIDNLQRSKNYFEEDISPIKLGSHLTKNISDRFDSNTGKSTNSFNVHLINNEVGLNKKNKTLPIDLIFTALTPVNLSKNKKTKNVLSINNLTNNVSDNNTNEVLNSVAATEIVTATEKIMGTNGSMTNNGDWIINNNGKTIDFDSWQILLGNHTLFPSLQIHQKNNYDSKDILNNETFQYLISPQYAKDKKLKSPGQEETAKSISLNYGVNNAGLTILTKNFNKIQGEKNGDKEKPMTVINLFKNYTDCATNSSFHCKNGDCVSAMSRCNQLVDCPDGSDEKNCSCVEYLQAQFLTRKICDGVVDCWDFSDENKCEWCTPGQYVCSDSRICVNHERLCDGNQDCPMGDDEKHCITIAPSLEQADDMVYYPKGYLMVRKEGQWGKLCVENFKNISIFKTDWTIPDVGRAVCKAMTYSDFDEVHKKEDTSEFNETNNVTYFELSTLNIEADLSKYRPNTNFSQTNCSRKEVVHISCKDLECGMRPQANTKLNSSNNAMNMRRGLRHSRIVGGGNASPGSWPWQAALYKEGEFQCGATLISDRWLLSAGHCFYHALEDYWVARLGTLRRGTSLPSPYEQIRPVSRILLHPGYVDTGFINDISLLQMKSPVKFTNYVRPICLPSPNSHIKDGSMCTVVGWGQLFEVGRIFPDTLQEVQLPVISTSECRKRTLFLPLYRVTENMLCAGYDRGGRDACLGDSGGPLMCQETDGRWSLLGVTSNGYGCARANRPGVYTKVSNYLSWVQNSITNLEPVSQTHRNKALCNGHRCPLGECLPLVRVCNGYMECSDGSDEYNCW